MNTSTPCEGADDWFVSSNRGAGDKPSADRENDLANSLRSKLTCLTRCPVRKECMETALSYEDNHHWVWGGYAGHERQHIAEQGPLVAPGVMAPARLDRINEWIDYRLTREEAAERWGMTVAGVTTALGRYIWWLRVNQSDPWTVLQATDGNSGDEMAQTVENVRAA